MAPFLNTQHKRKSAIITTILLLLFLFGIFNFGMHYLDPPEEYGLAINFGNSNFDNNEILEKVKVKTPIKKTQEQVKEAPKKVTLKENIKERFITKPTTKEVPVVKKIKEKKVSTKVVQKEKPKPSKATENALTNLLKKNTLDEKQKGEDKDKISNKKGEPNSSKYYRNTRKGEKGNYNLAGRKAISKPVEKPNCLEEGIVVVRIEVNKKGTVINAVPGVKGSTNTAICLLKPAKEAALKTQWNPDENAPIKQKGTIIYKFSLSK